MMIGYGSVLLRGIRIGDNVSIGTNSLLVQSVDNNVIVVGNPARVVKVKNMEEIK